MKAVWTPVEDQILRDAIARRLVETRILALLPGRTRSAIRSRLKRIGQSDKLGTQPHCQQRQACVSASSLTHCRRCSLIALRDDPDVAARRREGLAAYHALPETKAALALRIVANSAAANERPAEQERRRQQGLRLARDVLSRPDVRANNQAPDVRRRAGLKISETKLAGIPHQYRETYRQLVRSKRMSADAARALIVETAAADELRAARQAIDDFNDRQRARAQRERDQAY